MRRESERDRGVFVTYRRSDAPGHAGRIVDHLADEYGSLRVFMDVDAIAAGDDYLERIESAIESAAAMVVVIGPEWDVGRLADPADVVRFEIETALARGVPVLPVLVDDAAMPSPETVPASVAALCRRNAVALGDLSWRTDVERLVAGLDEHVRRPRRVRVPRPVLLVGAALAVAVGIAVVVSLLAGDEPAEDADRLLYRTSFGDGWTAASTNSCQRTPVEGALEIGVSTQFAFCTADADFVDDVYRLDSTRVDARASFEAMPQDPGDYGQGQVGVRCRSEGTAATGRGYSAAISPTGYFLLARYDGGEQRTLRQGTDASLARDLGTRFRLRLDCLDRGGQTELTFFVDGERISTYLDEDPLGAGAPGVEVTSFTDAGDVRVRFELLAVYGSG